MKKRILAAIPIILIVALALILQGYVLIAFCVVLALYTQVEMLRAMNTEKKVIRPVAFLFALACAGIFIWFSLTQNNIENYSYNTFTILMPQIYFYSFALFVFFAFITAIFSRKHDFKSLQNTIFAMCYPQLLFVFLYMAVATYEGAYKVSLIMLLFIFALPMLSDTLAYFIGKSFGKTKLCPAVSPNKTVAGSVAGIVGGMLCAFLIWMLFAREFDIVRVLILGAILAVVSQIGDLAASFIKRAVDIKDFGNLIPGHGGVLDRLDSILFTLPIVYIFFVFIGLF